MNLHAEDLVNVVRVRNLEASVEKIARYPGSEGYNPAATMMALHLADAGEFELIDRLERCGAVANLAYGLFKDVCGKDWAKLTALSDDDIKAYIENEKRAP